MRPSPPGGSPPDDLATADGGTATGYGGRFDESGPGLRVRTARGTIVNSAFMVALASLGFLKGFIVAAFLTADEYGIWGILVVTLGTLTSLRAIGIGDKFIQQDEADQELAFQKAFTIDTLLNGITLVVLVAATPLIAFAYDRPELVAPALVLTLTLPVASLNAPLWVFYRQMRFAKQRALATVNPLSSIVVTIPLAVAGLGYWSLVLGTVAGFWIGGLVAALASPYPLRFRYDRGTLRDYYSFSWPLFVDQGTTLVVAQLAIFVGEATLGLAGAGAIALASSIALYSDRLDGIVTGTLYPAICAVKDRTDLLFESFVKSNRLAMMWGIPFGIGLALFAPALVEFVLGEKWDIAIGLIQAFGAIAAARQIGFNWDAFYRARGDTRPIAVLNVVTMVVFVVAAIPLLIAYELQGFAIGMGLSTAATLLMRAHYLTRLFPGFTMVRYTVRAIAPTVPAVALVLGVRSLGPGGSGAAMALAELSLYIAATAAATFALERQLLSEVAGYLRRVEAGRAS